MAETVKFEKTDLDEVQGLQVTYGQLTFKMGQFTIEKLTLERRLSEIDRNIGAIMLELSENKEKEVAIGKKLQDKYGVGQLNMETGEFTPQLS